MNKLFEARRLYGRIKGKHKKREDCLLCGKEKGELTHLVMECQEYDHLRPKSWIELREEQGIETATRIVLFRNKCWEASAWTLERLLCYRLYKEKLNGGR